MSGAEGKGLRGLYLQSEVDVDVLEKAIENAVAKGAPDAFPGLMAAPFDLVFRKFTMRAGMLAWPLFGLGCFVQARADVVMLALVDMKKVVDDAGMNHLDNFVQSVEHKSIHEYKPAMIILQPGEVAWVPPGWAPIPTCCRVDICSCTVFPWVPRTFQSDMGDDLWEVTRSSYATFLRKQEEKKPWKLLAPLMANHGIK